MELVIFAASLAATVVLFTNPGIRDLNHQLSKNLSEYDECIQMWVAQQPQLQDRFQNLQLAWLCERTEKWLQKALKPREKLNEPAEMTAGQAEWLYNLRSCGDADCLQGAICKEDRCKFQKEISNSGNSAPEIPISENSTSGNSTSGNLVSGISTSGISTSENSVPGVSPDGQRKPILRPEAAQNVDVNRIDPDSIAKNLSEFGDGERQEKFRLRRCLIGRICRRMKSAAGALEAFPELRNKTKAEGEQKFKIWIDKCEKIQARINKRNETFEDWTADPICHQGRKKLKKENREKPKFEIPIDAINVQNLDLESMQNKKEISLICLNVLESSNASEAFPDFPRDENNWQNQLKNQFNIWTHKCNLLQNRFEDELGLTFEDFLAPELETVKVKENEENRPNRRGRSPNEIPNEIRSQIQGRNRDQMQDQIQGQIQGQNFDQIQGQNRDQIRGQTQGQNRGPDFGFDFEDPEVVSNHRQPRQAPGVHQHPMYDAASYDDLYDVPFAHASLKARRKEYRMTTKSERQKLHAAFNALKRNKIDDKSKYDLLTIYHTPQESPGAHWGPAFLPFHREMMKQ